MSEEYICKECGESFEKDEIVELEDESFVCEGCASELYETCVMCEKLCLEETMEFWGDARICPECLEEQCPSFDQEENEDKTEDAWNELSRKYVGKKVHVKYANSDVELEWGEMPDYKLTISIDDNGLISEVSRITARMLLWEGLKSSNWRDYPVTNSDYEEAAVEVIESELMPE